MVLSRQSVSDSRWEIAMIVESLISWRMLEITSCSSSGSRADVDSSIMAMRGFFRKSRARAILCFCPDDLQHGDA